MSKVASKTHIENILGMFSILNLISGVNDIFAPKDNRDVQIEILRVLKSTSPQVKAYVSDDMPEEVDVLVVIGNDFNRYGQ